MACSRVNFLVLSSLAGVINALVGEAATSASVAKQKQPYAVPKRRTGGQNELPGSGSPETGPMTDYVAYVFVSLGSVIICRLYELFLSDQGQATLQLRIRLSDLVI
jgi:hypothetical protein